MTTATAFHEAKHSSNAASQSLQNVLGNTYGLYLVTYNYHWNVEGTRFISLQDFFERQYHELFLAVDAIAERIRTLGNYAHLVEEENTIPFSKMTPAVFSKEVHGDDRAQRMLQNLMELNECVINKCQASKKVAQNVCDDASETLMIERITAHQKALLMLQSASK